MGNSPVDLGICVRPFNMMENVVGAAAEFESRGRADDGGAASFVLFVSCSLISKN